LDAELDTDMEGGGDRQQATEDTARSSEETAVVPTDTAAQQRVPDEGDDVRVYVFANQGRRGVDSLVSRRSRLEKLQPGDRVVEVRRQRYRTCTGRYVLEFEVRRVNGGGAAQQAETIWVNQKDYEKLWLDGRLSAAEDDGQDHSEDESRSDPGDVSRDEPRTVRARGRE
jgi:hypothetical protein